MTIEYGNGVSLTGDMYLVEYVGEKPVPEREPSMLAKLKAVIGKVALGFGEAELYSQSKYF